MSPLIPILSIVGRISVSKTGAEWAKWTFTVIVLRKCTLTLVSKDFAKEMSATSWVSVTPQAEQYATSKNGASLMKPVKCLALPDDKRI